MLSYLALHHSLTHSHNRSLTHSLTHTHYSSHRSTNLDKEEYYDESEESVESALSGTDYLLYSYGFVSEKEPEKYDISLPKSLVSEILRADLMTTDSRLEFFHMKWRR